MIVLIPSFEPDERLLSLVSDLVLVEGLQVLVVDDGSGPAFAHYFVAADLAGAEVLTHEVNRGKGVALRTGFSHVRRHHPGEPVVCADSDGQHSLYDILRVGAALDASNDLVLGARRFTGRVPLRSRFGNQVTSAVFGVVSGTRLTDTQTGLRAYPHRLLGWLLGVPGDRFEYELNLLLRASRARLRIREVEIATIYLQGNSSSHFRPLRDSLRIYGPLLAFGASSLAGFAVDAAVLLVLHFLTGNLAASVVIARLVSATVNFTLNHRLVFADRSRPLWPAARRYGLLAAGILAANLALMELLTPLLGSVVVAKILTEVVLFLASYGIQRHLVFSCTPNPRGAAVWPGPPAPATSLGESGAPRRGVNSPGLEFSS
ncbi:MAG: bifunctional glycosyltransferase family 2/GtrA family protein [Propionicimonas sp.]